MRDTSLATPADILVVKPSNKAGDHLEEVDGVKDEQTNHTDAKHDLNKIFYLFLQFLTYSSLLWV